MTKLKNGIVEETLRLLGNSRTIPEYASTFFIKNEYKQASEEDNGVDIFMDVFFNQNSYMGTLCKKVSVNENNEVIVEHLIYRTPLSDSPVKTHETKVTNDLTIIGEHLYNSIISTFRSILHYYKYQVKGQNDYIFGSMATPYLKYGIHLFTDYTLYDLRHWRAKTGRILSETMVVLL